MLGILDKLNRRPAAAPQPTALPACEEAVWAALQAMPPFRFPDGQGAFSVALVGDDPMRLHYFKQIFTLCQLHRNNRWVDLQFHIISTDPVAFLSQLMTLMPQVVPYLWVQTDYRLEEALKDLGAKTARKPEDAFARVQLHYPAETLKKQCLKLRKNKNDTPLANYILLLNPSKTDNEDVCKNLREVFVDDVPCFIGIGDGNPPQQKNPALFCRTLALDGSCCDDAALAQLEQRALQIHTFYEKEYDQRKSLAAIAESFGSNNCYNHRSSRRAALSIGIKLFRCDLADTPESARQLLDLLDATTDAHRETISSLLLMEHRSWKCFMLTEGWQLPTQEALFDPRTGAYTLSNPSHKLKTGGNYHPCLAESQLLRTIPAEFPISPEQLLPLQLWAPAEWDNPNKALDKLDPLDQMSVTLHRLLNKRIKEQFPAALANFRKQLMDQLEDDPALPQFQNLLDLSDRIVAGEDNNDWLWNKLYAALPAEAMQQPVIQGYIAEVRNIIRCAMERNAYRDYKKTDLDLLMALPAILSPAPAPVVYKLNAPVDWQNVVCSVMLEPTRLVLVHSQQQQSEAAANQIQYTNLFNARNSGITVELVEMGQPMDPPPQSVLDITGASPQMLLWALSHPALMKLPRVYYEAGKLCSADRQQFDPRFYARRHPWLTVRETLLLSGNELLSNPDTRPLLSLHQEYKFYFNALRNLSGSVHSALLKFLPTVDEADPLAVQFNSYAITNDVINALQSLNGSLITDLHIRPDRNRISFRYCTEGAKSCLQKVGNVLEALVYHALLGSGKFDDVRVGVKVGWYDENIPGDQTTNEVDVICTKGLRTFFISCKKTAELQQQYYPEIWYEAHRFGVDAVPVLVCTANPNGKNKIHIQRGDRMGVATICLDPHTPAADNARQLVQQLSQLFDKY